MRFTEWITWLAVVAMALVLCVTALACGTPSSEVETRAVSLDEAQATLTVGVGGGGDEGSGRMSRRDQRTRDAFELRRLREQHSGLLTSVSEAEADGELSDQARADREIDQVLDGEARVAESTPVGVWWYRSGNGDFTPREFVERSKHGKYLNGDRRCREYSALMPGGERSALVNLLLDEVGFLRPDLLFNRLEFDRQVSGSMGWQLDSPSAPVALMWAEFGVKGELGPETMIVGTQLKGAVRDFGAEGAGRYECLVFDRLSNPVVLERKE